MLIDTNKQYIVIGLGTSGLAAVRYLHHHGVQVTASESRTDSQIDKDILEELDKLHVQIETGGHTPKFFQNADVMVPSPGVPLDLPIIREARQRGCLIAGEMALATCEIHSPVIGVTGSNGKTTVTSLIGHLLEADNREIFVGGNIGTPVLDYLMGPQNADALVLELSSFQLEISGEFRPDIALLLNLTPDHVDRHGSMEKYADAKRRIFVNQGPKDIAIVGADDPMVMDQKITTAGTVLSFGEVVTADACIIDKRVSVRQGCFGQDDDENYDLAGTQLDTKVNRLNAAAAILAARSYGCAPASIRQGLASYNPPPHRMSLVAEIEGVAYIDDSKGTNVGAVAAALASCDNGVVLIAGGRDKDSDFSMLADHVQGRVHQVVLIGEAADRIEASLGSVVPVTRASSMEDAVKVASKSANSGDTVLLSPGCASFDMFDNYSHRGEVFQEAVQALRKISHDCC